MKKISFRSIYMSCMIIIFALTGLLLIGTQTATAAGGWITPTSQNASSYVAPYSPDRVIDASEEAWSRWYCGNSTTKWLSLTLPQEYSISQWYVSGLETAGYASSNNLKNYQLEGSTNGSTWITLDTVTGNTANSTTRSIAPTPVRYVRLNVTYGNQDNNYWASVLEFRVYGEPVVSLNAGSVTGMTAPAVDALPIAADVLSTGASTYDVTGLSWQNSDGSAATLTSGGKFMAGTEYKALIELTSAVGYKFQVGGFMPTVNTGNATAGTVLGGDVSGNRLTFTVTFPATAAPSTITFSDLSLSGDTGSNSSDFITRIASQDIYATLSAAPNATDHVYGSLDGGASWTDITTKVSGTALTWSNANLLNGTNMLQLKVGVDGAVTSQQYTHDTISPSTTINTVSFSTDTGIIGDFITNTAAQSISGTLSANLSSGEFVQASIDNGSTWTVANTIVGSNSWSITTALSISSTLKVIVIDMAGNYGATWTHAYTLDTTAPTVTITTGSTAGGDALVNVTEKASGFQVVARSSEATGRLYVVPSGTDNLSIAIVSAAIGSAVSAGVNTDTTIAIAGNTNIVNGTSYRVYAIDVAGNVSEISEIAFTVDTIVAPDAPSSPDMTSESDSGISDTDNVTGNTTPTITGTAAANSTVKLYDTNGTTEIGSTSADANGNWTLTTSVLGEGNHTITAKATLSGKTSVASSELVITIDTTAPTVSSVSVPVDGNYLTGQNLDFTANFSEFVTVVTTGGTPYFVLTIGGKTYPSAYSSGSGTSTLAFRYTVQAGDADNDGIDVSTTIVSNGGTLSDSAGNDAVLMLNTVGNTTGVLVIPVAELSGTVTISGTLKYGQTLTATLAGGNNTGILSYQWKRGGTNIGINSNTYAVEEADIDQALTCEVTSTEQTGFVSSSTSSVIGKADGPEVTGVYAVGCTTSGSNDGKLIGVTTAMQYKKIGDTSYTTGTGSDITGLTYGDYLIRVAATSTHEAGADSTFTVAAATLPEAPGIQSVNAGDAQVRITWNGVSGATEYKIYKSTTSGTYDSTADTVSGSVYSYDVTGLTNGTTYYFVVKASNAGVDSAASIQVSATPQVNTPDSFIVTFNTQDGRATTSISVVSGSAISVLDKPIDPARSGYTFVGWFMEAEGINEWNFSTDIVAANITIYAKWMEIPVTPETPAAPAVTANDMANTLTGANGTMEYSTDNGVTWYTYNTSNPPVFSGNQAVMVRVAAMGSIPSGNITTVQFTQNPSDNGGSAPTPTDPAVSGNQTIGSGTETITVDVKQGNTDNTLAQITIERSTKADGKKSDMVTYGKDKALETVDKLKEEGKDTARIVIPVTKDEVEETTITIPSASITSLSAGDINLQIDTIEAKVDISKDTLRGIGQSTNEDLYFRVVQVKDEAQKETVVENAIRATVTVSDNSNSTVSLVGNPVTIETNMSSTPADITIPLNGITIPSDLAERTALLEQLAVFIEHSDGEKEMVQGELVEYRDGVYGIKVHVNKFSTFTVVKTDAFLKSSENSVLKGIVPANATVKGTAIIAEVGSEVTSFKVDLEVSQKATWRLYRDKNCKKEITDKKPTLVTGINTLYVKVTAENGSSQVYTLTITKAVPAPITVKYGFYPLLLIAKGEVDSQILTFTKVSDADGYVLYGAPCGSDNQLLKIADLKEDVTSYKVTGLKKNTYYKYQVKAYQLVNGKKVILAVSKLVHSTTNSRKYANPTKVSSNVSTVSLNEGKSQILKCNMIQPENKIIDKHTDDIRYESTNKAIAVVDSTGKITAKAKGTCYVYAYAQNGIYKKIKVAVK